MPICATGDVEVHYEVGGAGPPLLLLNGLVASAFLWPPAWLARMERHHRVVRVSNAGTGLTPAAEGLTIERMALDALVVLDELAIERAHVLGFSMGGMVAQALALDHRARVERLVLVSTSTGGAGDVHPEFAAAVGGSGGDTASAAGSFFHLLVGPGFFEDNPASLADLAEGWQQAPTPPPTALEQMGAVAMFDSAERLAEIAAPTLVLHGSDDRLLIPGGGKRLAAGIPGAGWHEYEGVGHLLAYEVGDESAEVIVGFLAGGAATV